jgi:hypothetical protein
VETPFLAAYSKKSGHHHPDFGEKFEGNTIFLYLEAHHIWRYTQNKEDFMPHAQIMTLDEKLALGIREIELKRQGKFDEAEQLSKTMPVPPYYAKFLKDHVGLDSLLSMGLNLSEAEAAYGPEFLSR